MHGDTFAIESGLLRRSKSIDVTGLEAWPPFRGLYSQAAALPGFLVSALLVWAEARNIIGVQKK